MGYRETRVNVPGHYPVDKATLQPRECMYRWLSKDDLDRITWLPFEEFTARMRFESIYEKRMTMVDEEGTKWSFFFSQVQKMIPHMVNGVIEGRFKMAKKGDMFGLTFLEEE